MWRIKRRESGRKFSSRASRGLAGLFFVIGLSIGISGCVTQPQSQIGFSKAVDAYQYGNYEEVLRLLKKECRVAQGKMAAERKVFDEVLESMVRSMDRNEYEKMRREIEIAREALDSKMVVAEESFR